MVKIYTKFYSNLRLDDRRSEDRLICSLDPTLDHVTLHITLNQQHPFIF